MKSEGRYDLLIVGGGINGAGIARDAAGRGLKVLLVEQDDLGSATSSASTKLIHGGLRYLEYFEFRLVTEALAEREALLKIAPHIIWPLEFVLPHEKHLRPAWMIRAGLFLYDHLGHPAFGLGRHSTLPKSHAVRLRGTDCGAGLNPELERGFVYHDCWVDDARLVVLNARSAALHGAGIHTRTRFVSARREGDEWVATLAPSRAGQHDASPIVVRASAIVNAAGPWAGQVLEQCLGVDNPAPLRLVKGSHIVVPRIHEKRHAYILQNPDRRVVFLIPYEREFTLIGTTDVPVQEGETPRVSGEEVRYLCEAASRYTERTITPDEVVWSYAGVRALYDDARENPSAITRDYHLLLDTGTGDGHGAPLLSVFGGKITTYRRLAEHVLQKLAGRFPGTRAWTQTEPLPGGDFAGRSFSALLEEYITRYPRLRPLWLARLLRRHGTLAEAVLGAASGIDEPALGENFGGGLYESELRYLMEREWARQADDVLWRRTKCGLHMSEAERSRVRDYMAAA